MIIDHWQLIAKKLTGEISLEEERLLGQWLKSDPANEVILEEAEKIWKVSGSLKAGYSPDADTAWESVKARIERKKSTDAVPRRKEWLKIAAVVLGLFVLGFAIKSIFFNKSALPQQAEVIIKEIATYDSAQVFFLPDSSRVWLNTNSRLSYPEQFADSVRHVTLSGEAFFEISHNDSQPFIVQAGRTETRVLGTSFNIKAYSDEENVELTVVTGKVQFAVKDTATAPPIILGADEQVTYNKTTAALKKQKAKKKFRWWEKFDIEKDVNKMLHKARKGLNKKVKRP